MERHDVNDVIRSFLFSGMPIAKGEENSEMVNAVVESSRIIFDRHKADITAAAREYRENNDLDELLTSLLPAQREIWYVAYAPYWLRHCRPVIDHDDATEFTYYNDLIDMYWAWKWQEWKKKGEWCVTIMLPPTKGMIDFEYQRERR